MHMILKEQVNYILAKKGKTILFVSTKLILNPFFVKWCKYDKGKMSKNVKY